MKKAFFVLGMSLVFTAGKAQTLQNGYDNNRVVQTAPSAPIVIKAGSGGHALQIWGREDGSGFLEFYDNQGGGAPRSIFGFDSGLNFSATYHKFSGNIGLDVSNPGAKLSFRNVNEAIAPEGITWFNPAPLDYGIHRTAGDWSPPNYQQLRLSWDTGILMDPGKHYGKCYVDIQGNGLRITSGSLGVGTTDTKGYKLAVAGDMIAESIKVKIASTWPDFVFAKDYKLPTLKDIEDHIKGKGYLQGIPSAAEVKANGIDLGEMNAKLLQKIEELTLYLIEQNRQLVSQQKAVELDRSQLQLQQEQINNLQQELNIIKALNKN